MRAYVLSFLLATLAAPEAAAGSFIEWQTTVEETRVGEQVCEDGPLRPTARSAWDDQSVEVRVNAQRDHICTQTLDRLQVTRVAPGRADKMRTGAWTAIVLGGVLMVGYAGGEGGETYPGIGTLGLVGGVLPGLGTLVASHWRTKEPLPQSERRTETLRYPSSDQLEGLRARLDDRSGTTRAEEPLDADGTARLNLPTPGLDPDLTLLQITVAGHPAGELHPWTHAPWREAALAAALADAEARGPSPVARDLGEIAGAVAILNKHGEAERALTALQGCLERWSNSPRADVMDDWAWLVRRSGRGGALGQCADEGLRRNRTVAAHHARRAGQCRSAKSGLASQTRALAARRYMDTLQHGVIRGRDDLVARMRRMAADGDVDGDEQAWVNCVTSSLSQADDMLKGLARAHYQGFAHEFQGRFDLGSEGVMHGMARPGDQCAAWVRGRLGGAALGPVDRYLAALDRHSEWRCDD